MTHDAVIISLMRYALGFVGSCLPTDLFKKLDTMIINIAARKIGGLSRTTRIESLHFLSGTRSMSNLYVLHCAELLDSCLRATDSDVKARIEGELRAYLGVETLDITEVQITIPGDKRLVGMPIKTPQITWERTKWTYSTYCCQPNLTVLPQIYSSYTCHAEEILRFSLYNEGTYTFANTFSWLDVGLQVLPYNKGAPECSKHNVVNLDKILPPAHEKGISSLVLPDTMKPEKQGWTEETKRESTKSH